MYISSQAKGIATSLGIPSNVLVRPRRPEEHEIAMRSAPLISRHGCHNATEPEYVTLGPLRSQQHAKPDAALAASTSVASDLTVHSPGVLLQPGEAACTIRALPWLHRFSDRKRRAARDRYFLLARDSYSRSNF